ncbi:hypothetical protein ACMAZF_07275 [Psychrobium sp. nBUS_13]
MHNETLHFKLRELSGRAAPSNNKKPDMKMSGFLTFKAKLL